MRFFSGTAQVANRQGRPTCGCLHTEELPRVNSDGILSDAIKGPLEDLSHTGTHEPFISEALSSQSLDFCSPFSLFSLSSQKVHPPQARRVHTHRGKRGARLHLTKATVEGSSVYFSKKTKAAKREGRGIGVLIRFTSWKAEDHPVGNPGFAWASIPIPTNSYLLFPTDLSSDTFCASLFACRDLPFAHPPTLFLKTFSDDLTCCWIRCSSLCCHNLSPQTSLVNFITPR